MKNRENPLISVIIPAYNAEKFIEKCINSIQDNTYKNLEIIVVDDGSKDHTGDIVESLACDERIVLIRQENGGVSKARNKGIDHATGEYIAFVDADDYVRSDYFEKLIMPCVENGADSSCCVYKRVDFAGRELSDNRVRFTEDFYVTPQQIAEHYFEYLNMGIINFVFRIYRKTSVGDSRFSETLRWGEDGSFNLEVLEKCDKIYVSHEELYYYVVHQNQTTSKRLFGYAEMMIEHMGDIDKFISQRGGYACKKVRADMGFTCIQVLTEAAGHAESLKSYKADFYLFKKQPWFAYTNEISDVPARWCLINRLEKSDFYSLIYLIKKVYFVVPILRKQVKKSWFIEKLRRN